MPQAQCPRELLSITAAVPPPPAPLLVPGNPQVLLHPKTRFNPSPVSTSLMSVSLMKVLLIMSQSPVKWVRMKWKKAGLGFSRSRRRVQNSARRRQTRQTACPTNEAR